MKTLRGHTVRFSLGNSKEFQAVISHRYTEYKHTHTHTRSVYVCLINAELGPLDAVHSLVKEFFIARYEGVFSLTHTYTHL